MYDLRTYQINAINRVVDAIDRRPVLVAPTGSGKTVMAAAIVSRLDVPTLWLAHRTELIVQAAAHLEAVGLSVDVVQAGRSGITSTHALFAEAGRKHMTIVASVQTLVNRHKPIAELVVIDECHHATADTYLSILKSYPRAHVLGLTATPFRLDGAGLGDLFGELVVASRVRELVDAGYLHEPRVYSLSVPDLAGLKIVAGDYSVGGLAARTNTPELRAGIVDQWLKRANGGRTVAFAVDVDHSRAIVAAFQSAGVAAEHLDGSTGATERAAVLGRLRSGETRIVSNCMVLTEGWDLPALECAIIARPTASLNLHLQMIGRIMREAGGKTGAIVLDHAGNHYRHGMVTRHIDYDLHNAIVHESDPLDARRCAQCGLYYPMTMFRCPECGWMPPPPPKRRDAHVDGSAEMVEYKDGIDAKLAFWAEIEEERELRGFKEGWSYYRFKERFGEAPLVVDGAMVDPRDDRLREVVYEHFLKIALARGYAVGWASHRYRDVYGVWPRGFVADARERTAENVFDRFSRKLP